jgi:hypothetical protein
MNPTNANLSGLVGQTITLDPKLTARAPNVGTGAMVKGYGCALESNGGVKIKRSDSGGILWVPYAEGQAVVGYASGSQTWIASGPFSGCELAVGKGNQGLFGAHIARQSGSTAKADYETYRTAHGLSEWYWNQIPMPDQTAFSCSYVFVEVGGGGILHMSRVDVLVTQMGGGDGKITKVHQFK